MVDTIETVGNSLIQHGPYNDRIYLMKLDREDMPDLPARLVAMARDRGYSKVFAKIPAESSAAFREQGYLEEALVPGFYDGRRDAAFMGRFLTTARETDDRAEDTRRNLKLAEERWGQGLRDDAEPGPAIDQATADDAEEMSRVYREVFPSYPFPIHDPQYLRKTMETHVRYFLVRLEGRIAAISSAEMDLAAGNAEMTDFATLPSLRRSGLGIHLLRRMEQEMARLGVPMLYTIARSLSPGMNIVFSKMGYRFAGTLVNNTNISGQIENMNIWYKLIAGPGGGG
jgi:putative beta-lysine N-acetyltransferase